MDEIRVSFADIAAGQQSVASAASRIDGQLTDLRTFLAPLVADWTGTASETYQARQREIDAAWRDLNQVLASVGVHLGQAHDAYRETEMRNVRRYAG